MLKRLVALPLPQYLVLQTFWTLDDLEKYKPIVTRFYLGEHDVFYMRDFLFMSPFITMFMGIFLQMFIFDDKKMTEF